MANRMILKFPDYAKIHRWIRYYHGPAFKCSHCEQTGKNRYEWALIHGKNYEKNILNYIQLCVSCHRKYDMTEERKEVFRKHVLSKPIHNRCRTVIRIEPATKEEKKYSSLKVAASDAGCTHGAIIYAINNKTKLRGFYWNYESTK